MSRMSGGHSDSRFLCQVRGFGQVPGNVALRFAVSQAAKDVI